MEMPAAAKRQTHLDLVRILAILLVVFNHTGSAGFFRFAETDNPALRWIFLMASLFCTAGVPLFYMVSGALLLPKEETLRKLYGHRVLRVALALVLFSAVQYLYQILRRGTPFSHIAFLRTLYGSQVTLPYWFLYAYLAALMILPFLRRMAAGMTKGEYGYFYALYLGLFCLLPVLEELLFAGTLQLNKYLTLPLMTSSAVVYMLLGHFLNNVLAQTEFSGKRVLALCLCALAGMAVSGVMTLRQARLTGVLNESESQGWFSSFTILTAVAVFCLIRRLFARHNCAPGLCRVLATLSDCTFGVYLLHLMLKSLLAGILYYLEGKIFTFPACLVYVFCVAAAGYGITYLLRKIPFLRRLL